MSHVFDLADVTTALARVPAPDVVLLDVEDLDGEAIETLGHRARETSVPVVVLADDGDIEAVHTALRAGLGGWLPRRMPPPLIAMALGLVVGGERYVPASALGEQPSRGSALGIMRQARYALAALTGREIEVLTHVARGASNKEIARGLTIEEITVKSHMKSIFRKLQIRNRTQAAKLAMEAGLSPR